MTKRRTATKPDPFTFAMQSTKPHGGRLSWFESHREAKVDLEKMVDAIRKGSTISFEQICAYLKKWHGYPFTPGAVRGHIRGHYPDLPRA